MSYAPASGARLYYEEAGQGLPLIFVHEFGADIRQWEDQLRYFSRHYRCIAYNARGYPPSSVPDAGADFGYEHMRDDIGAIMDHLGIDRAHLVGLSMGAYASLMFALAYPERVLSVTFASGGSGAVKSHQDGHAHFAELMARKFLEEGAAAAALDIGLGGSRIQLQNKDPRGWRYFMDCLSEHDPRGSAMTLRNYQIARPSLYDFEDQLKAFVVPTLLMVGDEDEACLDVNLWLKRQIRSAGLHVVPHTGHAINLEEPAAFNAAIDMFLSEVDRGVYPMRDPRSLAPGMANPTAKGA